MYFHSGNDGYIDFLIFVEHKDRELEVACTLAHMFELEGYSVCVASSIYHQIPALLKVKPKVLITPFTGFGKGSVGELFYSAYGDSITFVNLNYEQFISSWKGSYKTSIHPFSKNKQIQLVWGEYFKDELCNNGVNINNIYVTGRPSLSLVALKYRAPSKNELKFFDATFVNKRICFIALTDGLAFIGKEKVDFIIKNGGERKGLEAHVEYIKKNISLMFVDIVDEANKNEDILFVMRPHPSIPESAYYKLFKELDLHIPTNILITKESNAYWWLSNSDWFVTNYSTLCLEAKVLGVKSFLYERWSKADVEEYWYTKSATKVSSISEVLSYDGGRIEYADEDANYYIDFEKDGLKKTVEVASMFLCNNEFHPIRNRYLVLLDNSKRMLGSLIRNMYVKIGFVPFGKVSKGLLKDYFNSEDVVKLLKGMKNEV
ncbi:hypothetical protein TUM3794_39620 [Shewanella colwelliana]|uniref:Polysaccharide biosynthesis enzyme WcbI domain-containing protein n=1 Tax=Shewanella colwelliana TaxID=23 RepID=A0ABQ4PGK4_SHECO|nr:hypothetical protein [Shewanella colwelliana]GIU46639.1 hypothetical protein TUM3794_39620 [Shewanella colwelliana]